PPALEKLFPLLQRAASTTGASDAAPAPRDAVSPDHPTSKNFYGIGGELKGWWFEPDIPALIHPIARASSSSPATTDGVRWLVVQLSEPTIRDKVLPDLANRYFMGTGGLDYQVA